LGAGSPSEMGSACSHLNKVSARQAATQQAGSVDMPTQASHLLLVHPGRKVAGSKAVRERRRDRGSQRVKERFRHT
jgi:hypothetical protein